jgi:phosphoribosylamine--glycine ligase
LKTMRFLGVGESCDLGSVYHRLKEDGHAVKVHIADAACADTFDGILEKTSDWRGELHWVGKDGIILFESVLGGMGAAQEALRAEGYSVIGGSAFGDRLENDRAFAQAVLRDHGFRVLPHWEFARPQEAAAFIRSHPGRYVLKFNGYGSMSTVVGTSPEGSDIVVMLEHLLVSDIEEPCLVLSPYIDGVEMGVGAYFTGNKFLEPACLDWEHKKFFPKDLGEMTPEMGTVVTYGRSKSYFEATLGKLASLLRREKYLGYINLNTIVNRDGIWPLEFTCRFAYPGSAILESLQRSSWAEIFTAMMRDGDRFHVHPGFAVGVVVTTPPFPYSRRQVREPVGLPLRFDPPLTNDESRNLHLGEVKRSGSQLVTAGIYGWTLVVTGKGDSIPAAQAEAYTLLDRLALTNARYRNDIGDRLRDHDFATVEGFGLLDSRDESEKAAS